ncbi:hypothetical protein CYLTODRAFT_426283 [Cylindrobasidium torrendii FP15055 ss-10]|uniref:NERD domain-containing protein n=1 Tax=Cylindrobasidium torrendii FP15055 ss-10 TaxID=1314674 RepID=A0A0D7AYE6_9AGAR|nr:hypothetical protein CYLTODRAFT_426283 [Cylindrobasidium torrendii FP15055 ss-10]
MSFDGTTSWPTGFAEMFNTIHNSSSDDRRYYAAYNKLLNWMFPSWDFLVSPHHESPDLLVVINHGKPMLFISVKSERWVSNAGTRMRADALVRQHYFDMLGECPSPVLWGVSALGTNIRLYQGRTNENIIAPRYDSSMTQNHLPRDYLETAWELDLLSQEGFNAMKNIAAKIKVQLASQA